MESDFEAEFKKAQLEIEAENASAQEAPSDESFQVRILSAREQETADKPLKQAVDLFFQNKFDEADAIFKQYRSSDPVASLGSGILAFFKAVMTFAESDMQVTISHFQYAERFCSVIIESVHPKQDVTTAVSSTLKSGVSSVARMGSSTADFISNKTGFSFVKIFSSAMATVADTTAPEEYIYSNAEFRAVVMKGVCALLSAVVLLLQESVVSYVKAGWNLRKGVRILTECYEIMQKHDKDNPNDAYDNNAVGVVQFGIGAINLILSILPAKILKLISAFGFQHDGELGLQLIQTSFDRKAMVSPLASVTLLHYLVNFSTFVPSVLGGDNLPTAEKLCSECLELWPGSALHTWFLGRIKRLRRDIPGAIQAFKKASDSPLHWKQFQHLCYYDLGLCYYFELNWKEALPYFQCLSDENYWSKAYYVYQIGVVHWMNKDYARANEYFRLAPTHVQRKFGGRTIAVEKFVLKKCARATEQGSNEPVGEGAQPLPGLEIVFLWNGFSLMSEVHLKEALDMVSTEIIRLKKESNLTFNSLELLSDQDATETPDDYAYDNLAVLYVLRGSIYKELKQMSEAEADLNLVREFFGPIVNTDTYVAPFASYELAIIKADMVINYRIQNSCRLEAELERLLNGAESALVETRDKYSDYLLEFRLHLRIHLALDKLRKIRKEIFQ